MPVGLEVSDGVAVLTLDRADVLNAFNDEFGAEALHRVWDASNDDEIRCIVITGAGRAFCSGEDLGALRAQYEAGESPPLGETLVHRYNPLIRAIRNAPKPVVAAINGVAAGAGVSIALACDFRIASEKAKLVLAFIKVALVPDSGALWFLTRIVGEARALELAMTGDPLSAQDAFHLGLVNKVVGADDFEGEWRAFATDLARGPTIGYSLTKTLVHSASERSLEDLLELEVDAQTRAGQTVDHIEGVRAFLEKRTPEFKGR